MHVIDQIQNLMLGITKHALKMWIEIGKLNDAKLLQIDTYQKIMKIRIDVSRIAHSISKSMKHKSMKADKWKNWTLISLTLCLRNTLPYRDITVFSFFVKACMILCKCSITIAEISQGLKLLTIDCKQFEILFGGNNCILNMHLALYLKEQIKDFGFVYGFWCFSFERYNGIMGNYHTNNHSIEI